MLELEEEAPNEAAAPPPKVREKAPSDSQSARVPSLEDAPESPAPHRSEVVSNKSERRLIQRRKGDRPAAAAKESRAGLGAEEVRGLLAERPELLEAGLCVYREDDDEAAGVGFATAVGDIDVLARDSAGGWVIIVVVTPGDGEGHGKELVGDLLQLMGWVRKHLGSDGQEVRGIVLLDSVPDDLGYAAAAVADSVEFKRYRLALSFETVDVI